MGWRLPWRDDSGATSNRPGWRAAASLIVCSQRSR
jgi:hypothetical protein